VRQTLYGVYGQDDYTVNSRLTLNLGLRWETTTDPSEVNGKASFLPSPAATKMVVSDTFFSIGKKNFEPRVGIAWQVTESGKTVLRAGAGIYHNQLLPWAFSKQLRTPPWFGKYKVKKPHFPDEYVHLTARTLEDIGDLIALKINAPFMKTPVTVQYNLSLQQEIFNGTVLQVAYAGNKSNHLLFSREANTTIPTTLSDGRKFFPEGAPKQNRAWKEIQLFEAAYNSIYNSVAVMLRRQSSSGFQGQVSYTFSKAIDEGTSVGGGDSDRSPSMQLDAGDRARDRGLSDLDSRHAFVLYFSYPLPFRANSQAFGAVVNGWTISGIGTFTAGLPFTTLLAAPVSRDGASNNNDRPDLKPGANQSPNEGTSVGCVGFPAGKKLGAADNFYDPCSFSLPLAGTYGNLGRNTLTGPGIAKVDFGLEKSFALGEQANLTFKTQVFNILNRANFGLPNNSPLKEDGSANPAAGRITYTTTSSRHVQFGLKINF
jgi:hypothetical protein